VLLLQFLNPIVGLHAPPDLKKFNDAKDINSDSDEAEGEVDGFIKERPSIAELEASERAAEREMCSDSTSSDEDDAGYGGTRNRTGSDASIIYSGSFLKQGVRIS
jgi:hypothetical protein